MHRWLSRAVSRNRSIGRPRVFVIRLDGLDDEIELIGAVDLPIHAVILAWREDVGFCEVVQAIDSARRVISHEEHNTGTVFHPREQEQVIGAEVEHREGKRSQVRAPERPQAMVSAVEGLPGGLLRPGISPQRGACSQPAVHAAGGLGFLPALRRLSPPSKKISEFSTNRSAMAVAMVVL